MTYANLNVRPHGPHEAINEPITRFAPRLSAALAAVGIALFWPLVTPAAILQLRPECRCRGPVVTLGDVADVLAADSSEADALAALELFPSPPAGARRFLRPQEIQDLLLGRGVNLLEHRLEGASQVVVLAASESRQTEAGGPLSAAVAQRAEGQVCEAVSQYLREQVSDAEPWTVNVSLDDDHAQLVAACAREATTVRGGAPPWVGMQRFEVTVSSSDGPVRFDVDAEVTLASSLVVAARSLPRSAVIRAVDVRLQPGPAIGPPSDGFHSIDEVVGKQTTRAIPEGKVLDRESVQEPLLVRRGEVITVYARSAGVRVRSTAKAREDGSLGDLIQVESLLDRATYFARVSGIQEVEIYARPVQAAGSTAAAVVASPPTVPSRREGSGPRVMGGGDANTGTWAMPTQGVPSGVQPVRLNMPRQIVSPEPRPLSPGPQAREPLSLRP